MFHKNSTYGLGDVVPIITIMEITRGVFLCV